MAPARLFFFTAASLVLLDLTVAAQQNDRKVIIKKGIICLTELNGARQKAGLTKLASSADLIKDEAAPSGQETAPSGIWDPVCKTLLDAADFKPTESTLTSSGTYAIFGLGEVKDAPGTSETSPQCNAAVKKWQEGFSAFEADPPVDKEVDYSKSTSEQIAFVTLYNPRGGASGQCAVAICEGEPQESAAKVDTKKVAGLVCMTSPNAFGTKALFTQDEWNGIKKILSSSAAAAVPSLLGLATLLAAAFLS